MHRTEMLKLTKSYEQKLSMHVSKNSLNNSSAVQCNVYCLHCELCISVIAHFHLAGNLKQVLLQCQPKLL